MRRLGSASAAVCTLLALGQLVMPLAAASHLHTHAHAHTHTPSAPPAADEPRGAHDGEPVGQKLRGATPASGHPACHLCHLIAGSQSTLLVTAEPTTHALAPELGRVGAASARRPTVIISSEAMPRAPPVGGSL